MVSTNTTLKVLTKLVDISGERFVLVELTRTDINKKFFGTISYNELDSKGCMKRELNGFEMCIADTIGQALDFRANEIAVRGMNEAQMIEYFKNKIRLGGAQQKGYN